MPGPRPTPTRLKIIRGNPGKQPLRAEPELAVLQQVPEAPAHFDGYARAEWDRVAVEQRPQLPQDEDAGDSEP